MNETPQQYVQRVVGYLEGRDPMDVLSATPRELHRLVQEPSRKSLETRTSSEKWSPAMILAHLADTEIVYAFRLRLMLGASGVVLQGIDQDAWAGTFDYISEDPAVSVEDFRINRQRTIRMLKKLTGEQWDCYGMHTERGKETVRRVVELLAGHDINHLRQIQAMVSR